MKGARKAYKVRLRSLGEVLYRCTAALAQRKVLGTEKQLLKGCMKPASAHPFLSVETETQKGA